MSAKDESDTPPPITEAPRVRRITFDPATCGNDQECSPKRSSPTKKDNDESLPGIPCDDNCNLLPEQHSTPLDSKDGSLSGGSTSNTRDTKPTTDTKEGSRPKARRRFVSASDKSGGNPDLTPVYMSSPNPAKLGGRQSSARRPLDRESDTRIKNLFSTPTSPTPDRNENRPFVSPVTPTNNIRFPRVKPNSAPQRKDAPANNSRINLSAPPNYPSSPIHPTARRRLDVDSGTPSNNPDLTPAYMSSPTPDRNEGRPNVRRRLDFASHKSSDKPDLTPVYMSSPTPARLGGQPNARRRLDFGPGASSNTLDLTPVYMSTPSPDRNQGHPSAPLETPVNNMSSPRVKAASAPERTDAPSNNSQLNLSAPPNYPSAPTHPVARRRLDFGPGTPINNPDLTPVYMSSPTPDRNEGRPGVRRRLDFNSGKPSDNFDLTPMYMSSTTPPREEHSDATPCNINCSSGGMAFSPESHSTPVHSTDKSLRGANLTTPATPVKNEDHQGVRRRLEFGPGTPSNNLDLTPMPLQSPRPIRNESRPDAPHHFDFTLGTPSNSIHLTPIPTPTSTPVRNESPSNARRRLDFGPDTPGTDNRDLTPMYTPSPTPVGNESGLGARRHLEFSPSTPSNNLDLTPMSTPSPTPVRKESHPNANRRLDFGPGTPGTDNRDLTPMYTPSPTPVGNGSIAGAHRRLDFAPGTPSDNRDLTPMYMPSPTPVRNESRVGAHRPEFGPGTPSDSRDLTPMYTPSPTPVRNENHPNVRRRLDFSTVTPSDNRNLTPMYTPSSTPVRNESRPGAHRPEFGPGTPSDNRNLTPMYTQSTTPARNENRPGAHRPEFGLDTPSDNRNLTPMYTPSSTPARNASHPGARRPQFDPGTPSDNINLAPMYTSSPIPARNESRPMYIPSATPAGFRSCYSDSSQEYSPYPINYRDGNLPPADYGNAAFPPEYFQSPNDPRNAGSPICSPQCPSFSQNPRNVLVNAQYYTTCGIDPSAVEESFAGVPPEDAEVFAEFRRFLGRMEILKREG